MNNRSYIDYSRGDGPPFALIFVAILLPAVTVVANCFVSAAPKDKPAPPKSVAVKSVAPANIVCKGKIVRIKWNVRPHPSYDVGRQEAHVIMLDRLDRYCDFYVYSTDDECLAEGNHVRLVMTNPDPDNEFRTREIVSVTPLYKREPSFGSVKTNGSF